MSMHFKIDQHSWSLEAHHQNDATEAAAANAKASIDAKVFFVYTIYCWLMLQTQWNSNNISSSFSDEL